MLALVRESGGVHFRGAVDVLLALLRAARLAALAAKPTRFLAGIERPVYTAHAQALQ